MSLSPGGALVAGVLLGRPGHVGVRSSTEEVLEHVHHEQEPRREQGDDTKANDNR